MAKRKSGVKSKFVKAPQAPRRFKSAYMFFSTEKHKEIRSNPANKKVATTAIAKLISQTWKSMDQDQRKRYHDTAEEDRNRYEAEKASYKGPWKVMASTISPESATAVDTAAAAKAKSESTKSKVPKHPPSVFILYMNFVRPRLRQANPTLTGNELTRLIAGQWKLAPASIKLPFIEEFNRQRDDFRQCMRQWQITAALTANATATTLPLSTTTPRALFAKSGDMSNLLVGKEIDCSQEQVTLLSTFQEELSNSAMMGDPQGINTDASRMSLLSCDKMSSAVSPEMSDSDSLSFDPLFYFDDDAMMQTTSSSNTATDRFTVLPDSSKDEQDVSPDQLITSLDANSVTSNSSGSSSSINSSTDRYDDDLNDNHVVSSSGERHIVNAQLALEAAMFIPNMNDLTPISDDFVW